MKMQKTSAFGVKTSFKEADLILIPVPWEVTASYGSGASQGPELIRKASSQLDFFNPLFQDSYNHKIHFEKEDPLIKSLNKKAMSWAKGIQKNWTENKVLNQKEKTLSKKVNQASQSLLDWIYNKALDVFQAGKIPAIVGGDHSVSESFIGLIGEKTNGEYGILHIDAHADLRKAYQGFQHSHASVMYNVINSSPAPKKLVQVGVRDLCEQEYKEIINHSRIKCYFDKDISSRLFSGENWHEICQEIIQFLPEKVYVSLDVDGLSWNYAPGTGTPVPGGLSFNQVIYLLSEIKKQNKKLITFDVVETAGKSQEGSFREWNGNVSSRLIYHLAGLVLSERLPN